MKKMIALFLFVMFVLPTVFAVEFQVEKVGSRDVMVRNVNEPATFDLKIKNLGVTDNFQFYNLLGFSMAPKGTVEIKSGETKDIQLIIYPKENLDYKGFYTFEYFIQGSNGEKTSERLTINMVDLKDAVEIGSGDISPETNSIEIFVGNKVNFDFKNLNVEFDSPFFKLEKTFDVQAYEKKSFDVELKKEDFEKLNAGFYTMNANVNFGGETAKIDGTIKFIEKDLTETTTKNYGFIINTQIINKENKGNVVAETEAIIHKNIVSRLFTTFSPEPDSVDRRGLTIYYTWKSDVKPGESLEVTVKTNWLFPFLVIFFIVAIVIFAKHHSKTHLVLKKKVSFVHAKGGEFALKVSVIASAKSYVERVSVIDRVPPLVKLYEKFGGERPTRVSKETRRIEWNLNNMMAGETRIMHYVIYSKVGVMGKFALPQTTAVYEKDGKIHETESNKTFFVAEQRKKDIED